MMNQIHCTLLCVVGVEKALLPGNINPSMWFRQTCLPTAAGRYGIVLQSIVGGIVLQSLGGSLSPPIGVGHLPGVCSCVLVGTSLLSWHPPFGEGLGGECRPLPCWHCKQQVTCGNACIRDLKALLMIRYSIIVHQCLHAVVLRSCTCNLSHACTYIRMYVHNVLSVYRMERDWGQSLTLSLTLYTALK